ncbi:hypothetical protein BU24DRAFT_491966 [Aaosphaeria arxii CBS 175.79]|uniref:Zn(2)-C6 fungal-type domain-containing protein n=1 Tax=Aaosphaeria arxii CBS 175.79 TaxID=1450172 RepID=A0A6A5XR33_9PLEO|nr:uncharacterized protein BU24DRAFT_491966 [Aaosphaeria arxii CBS 175.79]KAF2015755.1 hypothetical protein BU24DRAFT_491966 [Aaosphaeria arxii CBS 175.79]
MPNVGKPSKGCKNCRERKVKCDQKRPSCSQCLRTGRECHGYRDPLTMMFRNESDVVARKAQNRYEMLSRKSKKPTYSGEHRGSDSSSSSSSSSSSTFSSSSTSSSSSSHSQWSSRSSLRKSEQRIVPMKARSENPLALTYAAVPSIEDQGMSFFLANFVQTPTFVPRGNFDFMLELLDRPDTTLALRTSVTAAGLASLAITTKNPEVTKRAQQEYVSALNLTNKALQRTSTATTNSTLVSVILLGMYENFMHNEHGSLASWAKHVKGACTLMDLRGPEQLRDDVGLRIFQQFYGTILLVSLETGMPIPEPIIELRKEAVNIADYSVFGKSWTTKMVGFMARAITLTQVTTKTPPEMLNDALELDRELDHLKTLIPNIWLYETVYLDEPDEYCYTDHYHIYLDPWVAQMLNNLRSCRLLLHGAIYTSLRKGLAHTPPLFTPEYAASQSKASLQVLRAGSAGICAATPQIIGQLPFPTLNPAEASEATHPSDLIDAKDPKYRLQPPGTFANVAKPTGIYHLIWPLYAIGAAELSPPDLTAWTIKVLYFIALKIGMRQAVALADELSEKLKRGVVIEAAEDSASNLPSYQFGKNMPES